MGRMRGSRIGTNTFKLIILKIGYHLQRLSLAFSVKVIHYFSVPETIDGDPILSRGKVDIASNAFIHVVLRGQFACGVRSVEVVDIFLGILEGVRHS